MQCMPIEFFKAIFDLLSCKMSMHAVNAAFWKVRSYIAVATACTCISVASYLLYTEKTCIYAGLVSVHIDSYIYPQIHGHVIIAIRCACRLVRGLMRP